ncbi:hypothetical protein GOBAR_AA26650 [Gossypium barbadense]|uniref:Uncharacterized protein n=1 Tax=Gossypium barbadense TaxID=3634 RepID=A0A2P5WSF9_GOSBA|nr:hypothetical protein GOBAR_AA26650 [Gossypium barbadense]
MGHARVPSFQRVRLMVFEIGHIGAHGHVARPCHSSFASPMPVGSHVGEMLLLYFYTVVSHGRVGSRGMCMAYGTPKRVSDTEMNFVSISSRKSK